VMRWLRPGRSRWIVLTGLICALTLVVLLWLVSRTDPLQRGSLDLGSGTTHSGLTADVGTRWVFGLNLAVNKGAEPVRLVKADLLPRSPDGQTEIISARVDEELPRPGVDQWPGADAGPSTTKPVAGYVIPPGGEVGILFVFEPRKLGQTDWTVTRVTYKEGSRTRVAEVNNGLVVCAPRDLNNICERPRRTATPKAR
jgi:hypothetical protein